jgi:penicillin-binding protein 2
VVDPATRRLQPVAPQEAAKIDLKPENVAVILHAMEGVNIEGTGRGAFKDAPYTSGGKTGTAQVYTVGANETYRESEVDERHRDHALFIAFAPAQQPKVVVALVVENGGFGAAAAAPIARRVLDYVLLGQYPSVEDIAAVREAKATAPIGTPRNADAGWPPVAADPAVAPAG